MLCKKIYISTSILKNFLINMGQERILIHIIDKLLFSQILL